MHLIYSSIFEGVGLINAGVYSSKEFLHYNSIEFTEEAYQVLLKEAVAKSVLSSTDKEIDPLTELTYDPVYIWGSNSVTDTEPSWSERLHIDFY